MRYRSNETGTGLRRRNAAFRTDVTPAAALVAAAAAPREKRRTAALLSYGQTSRIPTNAGQKYP